MNCQWLLLEYDFYDLDYKLYQLRILHEFEVRASDVEDVLIDTPEVIQNAPSCWL